MRAKAERAEVESETWRMLWLERAALNRLFESVVAKVPLYSLATAQMAETQWKKMADETSSSQKQEAVLAPDQTVSAALPVGWTMKASDLVSSSKTTVGDALA